MARSPETKDSRTPSGQGPATPPDPDREREQRWKRFQLWWFTLMVLLAANYLAVQVFDPSAPRARVSYSFFKQQVEDGNVVDVTTSGDVIRGTFAQAVAEPRPPAGAAADSPRPPAMPPDPTARFETRRPSFAGPQLENLLEAHDVVIEAVDEDGPSWLTVLLSFGPTLLLIAAFVWLSRRAQAGAGMFGLGRSRAKRFSEEQAHVTFDDVAGIDEAENELKEIVDFLKNPSKYQRLGGTVPRGVLLVGAPGTGKTLLARAVAGQAGVPFFSLSASEFVEMIVGVGAARVRDLFRQAREAAPSIIFIDELDAIGRARGSGPQLGGHDEREQTLNQILTEMDGFDAHESVIVLAATNRPDVLDSALLRAGRFDRRIVVQRPDRPGRAAILKVHTRNVPLAAEVTLDRLAAETPGLVGAELRNLVNEAALLAARRDADTVGSDDFAEALEKITLGPARKLLLDPAERERIAYHEAGHALLAMLVPGSDPVHRVSIVPRGQALGVTQQLPIDDRTSYGEDYLRARISGALGGRAAEKLVYGLVTTGAENDLQQVTALARQMVLRWGMSDKLGPMSFVAPTDDGLPPAFQHQPYSEATAELIDAEVRRIVDECHHQAEQLLASHRANLDALAAAVLEAESLDESEIHAAAGLVDPPGIAAKSPRTAPADG